MAFKPWLRVVTLACGALLSASAWANFPSVPKELYKALNLEQSASPKELHEAVVKRYKDPAQGAGRGTLAKYWEPIPMSMYFDPASFYKPPTSMKEVAGRDECVKCHTDESPVWVAAWKKSTHANLDKIRNLKPEDATFYKKAKLEEVEKNLRSMNRLGANEKLKEVGCIDCHVDINAKGKADHMKDLRMPTADVCGVCHLAEFAERESERDTLIWPNKQWPQGRPSHALDWKANVEVAVFASMPPTVTACNSWAVA